MYKENAQFKMICKNMIMQIEEFKILKNDKFNICLQTIANAVCNPLKISYIKKEKIVKLIEHAGIVITEPTTEERNKYYNACTLRKFANNYFVTDGISTEQLEQFNEIVTQATAAANLLLPKTFHVLDAEHIPQIYNFKYNNDNNHEPFNIGKIEGLHIKEKSDINASCMQGKPRSYFEIYNDINTDVNTLKMAILTQGNEIVARSLVWIDKATEDIDRRKKMQPHNIFIDRIYTKTQDHRAETQTQLFKEVHKYFKIDIKTAGKELNNGLKFANCCNWYDIKRKVIAEQNTTKEIYGNNTPYFDVEVKRDSYDYYPYCDTYNYFNTYDQTLSNDESSNSDILKLDNVSGEASENMRCCDECGCETSPEYITFIDSAEMEVCEDCAVYCEDRGESILQSDAVYNNQTSEYHHRDDLDY